MTEFFLKVGTTGVPLVATLKDADGTAIDLTDADVFLRMALPNTSTLKINNAVCEVLNQVTYRGQVRYEFDSTDVNTAGEYDAEFKVLMPDNTIIHYPTDTGRDAYIRVHIIEALA